jgi:hypothetical protein
MSTRATRTTHAVTTTKLAPGAVTADKLAPSAVTTPKIAPGAIPSTVTTALPASAPALSAGGHRADPEERP